MSADAAGLSPTEKSDTERLHELGYAQELGRRMQGFSNMAVSFSIISILAGCLTTFYLALYAGGGPAIAYGWPIVTFMALTVAWMTFRIKTPPIEITLTPKVDQAEEDAPKPKRQRRPREEED